MPRYDEHQARAAIGASQSYAEALRRLGLRPAGGNHALFRRYVDEIWHIPTDHFEPTLAQRRGLQHQKIPLGQILVEHSGYSRASLKRRLFDSGVKARRCELCGQGEDWRGLRMSLILDHINGIPDDNRLENLRVVCPNCAATFDTHCGRKNQRAPGSVACEACGAEFVPNTTHQRHCSRACGTEHGNRQRGPLHSIRKVERPSYAELLADLESSSYVAVGRRYGVSDNAVRKWIRWYEADAARRDAT
ncbi:MAG: hypothetical protein ACR2NR_17065 [Solirubrobacteraceae bacterium]